MALPFTLEECDRHRMHHASHDELLSPLVAFRFVVAPIFLSVRKNASEQPELGVNVDTELVTIGNASASNSPSERDASTPASRVALGRSIRFIDREVLVKRLKWQLWASAMQ